MARVRVRPGLHMKSAPSWHRRSMRRLKGKHRFAIRQRSRRVRVLLPTLQGSRIIGGVERNPVGSRLLTSEPLFRRLVRQVCRDIGRPHLSIDKCACQAMQEVAEFFLIREFKLAESARKHAGHQELEVEDMRFASMARKWFS